MSARGKIHNVIPDPRAINAKVEHGICNDAADQSGTVVMIGHPFAAPYLFIPVHKLCAAAKSAASATPKI